MFRHLFSILIPEGLWLGSEVELYGSLTWFYVLFSHTVGVMLADFRDSESKINKVS